MYGACLCAGINGRPCPGCPALHAPLDFAPLDFAPKPVVQPCTVCHGRRVVYEVRYDPETGRVVDTLILGCVHCNGSGLEPL